MEVDEKQKIYIKRQFPKQLHMLQFQFNLGGFTEMAAINSVSKSLHMEQKTTALTHVFSRFNINVKLPHRVITIFEI